MYYYEYVEHDWIYYIAAFAVAFGVALFLTPLVKKLAFRLGAVAKPRARDLHNTTMPRLGGLAIFLGFMVSMGLLMFFMEELRTLQFAGFVTGAVLIAGMGMLDDIFDIKPIFKLLVQISVALIVVFTGTSIDFIGWDMPAIFESLSIPITVIWIVFIINAVNLIDGVDGLAAGVSSIAAVFLVILCIMTGSPLAVVFAAALAGASLGFLPRNFKPAEIFMGDIGSTFIGYVLAVSSIIGVYKSYALLSVAIVGFALILPIMDTVYVFASRILKGKNPLKADRGHLHHKLIDRGYSHKTTVVILYAVSIFAGTIAILIAMENIQALIIGGVLLFVLFSTIYVYRKRVKRNGGSDDK